MPNQYQINTGPNDLTNNYDLDLFRSLFFASITITLSFRDVIIISGRSHITFACLLLC